MDHDPRLQIIYLSSLCDPFNSLPELFTITHSQIPVLGNHLLHVL